VEVHPVGRPAQQRLEPFLTRLRRCASDPSLLSNPVVVGALCLFRSLDLIAPLPYWLLVTLVVAGGLVSIFAAALWGDDRRSWHLPLFVAANMGVITVVVYATGWGPILAIGFVFVSGSAFQIFGAKATRWILFWTCFWMVSGQIAIGLGIAPTLIPEPLVHGLAGLSLLGTLITISLLGRVTGAREDVETELRQSEGRFRALLSNSDDLIVVTDAEGSLQYASPAFERQLGMRADQFYGMPAGTFVHRDDLSSASEEFRLLHGDASQILRTRVRIHDGNGNWRHFEAAITNRLEDPDVRGIVSNLHDVTDLLEANERFRSAFEDAPIGMALTTLTGVITRANRAFGSILGRSREEVVGRRIDEFTHFSDSEVLEADLRLMAEEVTNGYERETRFVRPDACEVWALTHVSCVRDSEAHPQYLIAQIQDVTEQRFMREHLAHAAIHDPLTGLPNRVLFMDRLEVALSRATRHGGNVAVAFLDLDRFKLVNDALGHAAGDDLLKAVAARLKELVRDEDTVARFGGDEFTVLWEDLRDKDEPLAIARRLLEELERPFHLADGPAFVSGSMGVAVRNSTLDSSMSMLRDADTAMYLAKEAGRGRVEVFDGKSHAVAVESLHVINELHSALENEEFCLHYQPVVELESECMVGLEALVRWQHPTRGLLGPQQFVPLAEECGLIVPIGNWLLQQACEQMARWNQDRGAAGLPPLEIHVNISPRQLVSVEFAEMVGAVVRTTGLEPGQLCLEITETSLMRDERSSADALCSLRRLGTRISIDDFGTGYSSLSYLKQFPIDSLKVDRSFVDGLGEDPDDSIIVSAVIALAHSLGLTAIAEGVESESVLEGLRRLGCDRAQGFIFGRPQPPHLLEVVPALAAS
jgi:diguanylate cyclase (GGDEF)-like protein/PAS domain S-box-containing protein